MFFLLVAKSKWEVWNLGTKLRSVQAVWSRDELITTLVSFNISIFARIRSHPSACAFLQHRSIGIDTHAGKLLHKSRLDCRADTSFGLTQYNHAYTVLRHKHIACLRHRNCKLLLDFPTGSLYTSDIRFEIVPIVRYLRSLHMTRRIHSETTCNF